MSRGKLDPKYAKHVADVLREVIRDQYKGNTTHFSDAARVSQSQISEFLKDEGLGRSLGIDVLIRLRNFLNMSFDDFLGLPPLRSASSHPGAPVVPLSAVTDAVEEGVRRALASGPPRPSAPPPVTPIKSRRQRRA